MQRRSTGVRRLAWPRSLRVLSTVLAIGSVGVWFAASLAGATQFVVAIIVASGLSLCAMYLFYNAFFVQVWWDRDGMHAAHPLGRRRFVPWNSVSDGGYRRGVQAFVLQGASDRIWYSPVQTGLHALHRYMSFRLRAEGVLLWHGFEVHGEGLEADMDGARVAAGFYCMVWVRDTAPERARATAVSMAEIELTDLRRTPQTRLSATLMRSVLGGPNLRPVTDDVRRTGFALYRE